MIGIILTTHSNFAEGLKNAVTMIAGEQQYFESICFYNGEDIEDLKGRIASVAASYEKQNIPVLYLVDMTGASPFNASAAVATEHPGMIIAGVSMPMLLELILTRETADTSDLSKYLNDVMINVKESLQVVDIQALMG